MISYSLCNNAKHANKTITLAVSKKSFNSKVILSDIKNKRYYCSNIMPKVFSDAFDIVRNYKGLLLDQYGVLHNGHEAYPGAVELVRQLHEKGVAIVIISNSSRRSSDVRSSLTKYGFKSEWFTDFITSGELTYQCLLNRPTDEWRRLGNRCVHVTWTKRPISIEGLGLQIVTDVRNADFILVHGTEGIAQSTTPGDIQAFTLSDLVTWMENAAKTKSQSPIPLILANPDIVTVTPAGTLLEMPGYLAQSYAAAGGIVRKMGKPDPGIYAAAIAALGLSANEVIGIGDSLEHDVAGANAAGIDSLFVAGGIHASEVIVSHLNLDTTHHEAMTNTSDNNVCNSRHSMGNASLPDYTLNNQSLDQLCDTFGARPTFVTPYFSRLK